MDSSAFAIETAPNTDIWKKPPSHDVFTGPSSSLLLLLFKAETTNQQAAPFRTHSKRPTSSFCSATLTFAANYTLQYDQAGILLIFTDRHNPGASRKWIKAGIELYDGVARLSTVCCDAWADWSVAPVPDERDVAHGRRPITLSIEKHIDASGLSLWVYHVVDADGGRGKTKIPMREVCWPFGEAASEGWELEVAAAVARPAKDTKDKFEAKFDHFDVEWK